MQRCDALARHSELPGGLTRVFLSPEGRAAGDAVLGWMREAGMQARLDAIGNVVGRYEGARPGLPCLMLGSHLDTVRDAGKYDGMLGVVSAIECVHALNSRRQRLPFAIEVVGFGDEEGVRFGTTLLGSRAIAGTLDPKILETKDIGGTSIAAALRGFGLDPDELAGVNDREELARAGRALVRRIASDLMRAGVTMEDPDRFDCHVDVEVGADTVIEPNVRLLEGTRVGQGCRVGAGTILWRTEVADGAEILPYTLARESRIGPKAIVGPFSRLRPGSEIGPEAHLGAFVETKKTRLGKGSKANHLAYLGDADIGAGVNVGAGTITCNYDGEAKHPTRIGDGAFIGSDAILVAPIEIGAGAYVAAGSTLTDSVPPGALALGRAHQVVKEGWAEKRRAARKAKKR